MLPDEEQLPPPSNDYQEIETAKLHGGWSVWEQIPEWRRAWLMAHELHKSRRDAYYRERVMAYAKKEKKKYSPHNDPLEAIKASMGMKY